MRRLLSIFVILLLVIAFIAIACVAIIYKTTGEDPVSAAQQAYIRFTLSMRRDELFTSLGTSDQSVRFVVEPGTPTGQIATNLVSANLIGDATLFTNYTIANNIDVQLEAGTYFLSNNMTIPEIAERLTDSNSSQIVFRILEGWRKEEIAAAIDQNGLFGFTGTEFLAVLNDETSIPAEFADYVTLPEGASLEGFLYPDTYQLPPGVTPEDLRNILLNTFREKITIDMMNDALAQNLTLFEVVTLASIAEREAVHAEEHPLIMSVYRNRLTIGMRLEADPTVQYPLNNTRGSWWADITRADYANVNSPYNTYLYSGLPPGPISNPGVNAISAAIYPEESDYLFFRAFCDNSGYHEFAVTYEEHLANGCTG